MNSRLPQRCTALPDWLQA